MATPRKLSMPVLLTDLPEREHFGDIVAAGPDDLAACGVSGLQDPSKDTMSFEEAMYV